MPVGSTALLLGAAGAVAVLHAVLPDHWVPLAVIGRAQRWSPLHIIRVSGLAAAGHVLASLILAGVVAVIGLRFQALIDREQGRIVGGLLIVTGLGFLVWSLAGRGHHHDHEDHHHDHGDHDHEEHDQGDHDHPHDKSGAEGLGSRLAAIIVPFGIAASPDLTILPVALGASAYGTPLVIGVLVIFAVVTMGVFVGLTLVGAYVGYQIKGEWLERRASTITALVLMAVGVVAFVGL